MRLESDRYRRALRRIEGFEPPLVLSFSSHNPFPKRKMRTVVVACISVFRHFGLIMINCLRE